MKNIVDNTFALVAITAATAVIWFVVTRQLEKRYPIGGTTVTA